MTDYDAGWRAHVAYQTAQRRLSDAGSSSMAVAVVCILYGVMVTVLVTVLSFEQGWSNLSHPIAEYFIISAFGLIIIGVLAFRRSRRSYAAAKLKFDNEWGDK